METDPLSPIVENEICVETSRFANICAQIKQI